MLSEPSGTRDEHHHELLCDRRHVTPDAPSYVERQADTDLYEGLTRGEFCYVLTSRQMGKSPLMARTAHRRRQEGDAVATRDLTDIGQNLPPTTGMTAFDG